MRWGGNVYKILMLAFANIRKTKGHTVSLFIMFLIASLLLNAGLLVFINFGGFFSKTMEELNTSDIYYIMPRNKYNSEVDEFIKNNENVIESQTEESLWGIGESEYNDETHETAFLLCDADEIRNMSKWKFVGEHLLPEGLSIYLPSIYQQEAGFQLNDEYEITFNEIKLTFTIKGFIEDVYFSSFNTGFMGLYLPHETYVKVADELGDSYQTTIIYANLKELNKDIEKGIKELTKLGGLSASTVDTSNTVISYDSSMTKMARTMMANMISTFIVAFAAMIVFVCLIVVRFRIGNSIEDDMTKIGSLKAVGYTSRQIVSSIIVQYVLITLIGSVVGISLSYLTTPTLSDVFAQQSGLKWVQGFDGIISSIALLIVLIIVIIVAFITSGRINILNPIVALRGGITTHSFRKNHVPLSTSIGSLPFVLALKSLLQNKKQSLMIAFIMTAVSFSGSYAVIMFYNSTIDTKTFLETPGIELSNAAAILKPDVNNKEMADDILAMEDVSKVQFIDDQTVKIDSNDIALFVLEDFSKKETDSIYEGRYPLHSNEIALAGHLAELLGKTIGDNVTVELKGKQAQFIVSGLSQGFYMNGINASIRYDGMIKLDPGFQQKSLQIYLEKGVKAEEYVIDLEKLYGDSFMSIVDMDKSMENGSGAYSSIVSKVGILILVVTLAVDILVLYFVINSSVTRRKRELGIQKAIGYTTLQLMNQLSLNFLPPIIIGVIIGGILGITQTNPLMSIAQRSMGIMKADYILTPVWVVVFGVAIIIISYITSMLITYKIRKISAYALVTE